MLGAEPVPAAVPCLAKISDPPAVLLQALDAVRPVEAGALGVAGPLLPRLRLGAARLAVGHRARRQVQLDQV